MSLTRNFDRRFVLLLLIVPALVVAGCGDGASPGRGVPVSGKVTMGGKPLAGANITFMNDTFAGFAHTDADGNYKLVQGALPGMNKVAISKIEGGGQAVVEDTDAGMDSGQFEAAAMGAAAGAKAPAGPKELVPTEYSSSSQTKLTFDVPAGGAKDVNFDI